LKETSASTDTFYAVLTHVLADGQHKNLRVPHEKTLRSTLPRSLGCSQIGGKPGHLFLSTPIFVNDSPKALRKSYRARMRSDLRRPEIFILAAALYLITYLSAALLTFARSVIGIYVFKVAKETYGGPLPIAFWWANLIVIIFLIAIAVLYILGGLPGIPFRSAHKNANDKT
jgi:hypothetical protein